MRGSTVIGIGECLIWYLATVSQLWVAAPPPAIFGYSDDAAAILSSFFISHFSYITS